MTTRNEVTSVTEKTYFDNNNTDISNKNEVVLNDLPKGNDAVGYNGGDAGSVNRSPADVEAQQSEAQPPHNHDDIGPPPDGGLTAWLVVLSTMFLQFCVFGLSKSHT